MCHYVFWLGGFVVIFLAEHMMYCEQILGIGQILFSQMHYLLFQHIFFKSSMWLCFLTTCIFERILLASPKLEFSCCSSRSLIYVPKTYGVHFPWLSITYRASLEYTERETWEENNQTFLMQGLLCYLFGFLAKVRSSVPLAKQIPSLLVTALP